MKKLTAEEIEKRGRAALAELEWAQRRIEQLKRNAEIQHEELAKISRDLEIIKKRDTTVPPEWSALATCDPPNRYM